MKRIWTLFLSIALILGVIPVFTGIADAAVEVIEPDYAELINLRSRTMVIDANGDLLQWGGGEYSVKKIASDAERIVTRARDDILVVMKDGSLWRTEGANIKKVLNSFLSAYESAGAVVAVDANGDAWNLGVSISDKPQKIASGVKQYERTIMLMKDGSVEEWINSNDATQPRKYRTIIDSGVESIYQLGTIYAAIKEDNSLWMWGSNICGQVGTGTLEPVVQPAKVLDNVKSVYLGTEHTVALKTDGTVWTWGTEMVGSLGTGTVTWTLTLGVGQADAVLPTKVMDGVKELKCFGYRSMALKNDGSLWMWGPISNTANGSPTKYLDNVKSFYYCSLRDFYGAVTTSGELYTWGNNNLCMLGDGTRTNRYTPAKVMDGVDVAYANIDWEYETVAAVKSDGSLWMWGLDDNCETGIADTSNKSMDMTKTGGLMSKGRRCQMIPQQVPGVKMAVKQTVVTKGVASMTNFTVKNTYSDGLFTDVPSNSWYKGNVQSACELGIMGGKGERKFDPNGNITVAEAIKMACVVYDTYYDTGASFTQGNPWYQVFVDYAVAEGIIKAGDFSDFTAPANRAQMAYIFAHALPSAELLSINSDVIVPDVNESDACGTEIYQLYQAGVLTGSDEAKSYRPTSNISRLEAATIITRIADAAKRVAF